jgi:hypothetical protein
MLFLDIKNAFNAMNHRTIFHVMKLCGFPADDVGCSNDCTNKLSSSWETSLVRALRVFLPGGCHTDRAQAP